MREVSSNECSLRASKSSHSPIPPPPYASPLCQIVGDQISLSVKWIHVAAGDEMSQYMLREAWNITSMSFETIRAQNYSLNQRELSCSLAFDAPGGKMTGHSYQVIYSMQS